MSTSAPHRVVVGPITLPLADFARMQAVSRYILWLATETYTPELGEVVDAILPNGVQMPCCRIESPGSQVSWVAGGVAWVKKIPVFWRYPQQLIGVQ